MLRALTLPVVGWCVPLQCRTVLVNYDGAESGPGGEVMGAGGDGGLASCPGAVSPGLDRDAQDRWVPIGEPRQRLQRDPALPA